MPNIIPVPPLPQSNLSKAVQWIGTVIGTDNPTAQALATLTPPPHAPEGGVIGAAQRLQLLQQQLGITR